VLPQQNGTNSTEENKIFSECKLNGVMGEDYKYGFGFIIFEK